MFGIGGTELIVLFVILGLLLGPDQIPGIVKSVQKFLREVSKAREDFKQQVDQDDTLKSLKDTVQDVKRTVNDQVSDVTAGIRSDIQKIQDQITKPELPEDKKEGEHGGSTK